MSQPAVPLEWQEHVRESILFGLLFKVAMVDQQTLRQIPLSLSYVHLLDHLSRWAERRHHYLRRALLDRGCEVIGTQTKGAYIEYRLGSTAMYTSYAIPRIITGRMSGTCPTMADGREATR
ncbi:hypothetical protein ACLMAB_01815 [Brevibacillus laterosporus]